MLTNAIVRLITARLGNLMRFARDRRIIGRKLLLGPTTSC
jgi:hypothetical protein